MCHLEKLQRTFWLHIIYKQKVIGKRRTSFFINYQIRLASIKEMNGMFHGEIEFI